MTFSVLIDKSPQGFIDKDILPLLTLINNDDRFETTSSCSGRITLMRGVKKGEAKWEYKNHFHAELEKIWGIVSVLKKEELLRFLYEPFIIHLKCRNFEEASKFLSFLHGNGLKKSGMISGKNLIIEINDSGKMETLLTSSLTKDYIKTLVDEANRRLASTKTKIRKLEKLFEDKVV